MAELIHTSVLVTKECCSCGGCLALSKAWVENARNVGNFKHMFWCPYCGTKQGWGESRHERELRVAREHAERMCREAAYANERRADLRAELEHTQRAKNGLKGAYTRLKNKLKQ